MTVYSFIDTQTCSDAKAPFPRA